jgi:hypothetical protein
MCSEEALGQGALVPFRTRASQPEIGRELGAIAERAGEWHADPPCPTLLIQHPGSILERGMVTDMLVVTAGELSDPVMALVLVVARDRPVHADPTSALVGNREANVAGPGENGFDRVAQVVDVAEGVGPPVVAHQPQELHRQCLGYLPRCAQVLILLLP